MTQQSNTKPGQPSNPTSPNKTSPNPQKDEKKASTSENNKPSNK